MGIYVDGANQVGRELFVVGLDAEPMLYGSDIHFPHAEKLVTHWIMGTHHYGTGSGALYLDPPIMPDEMIANRETVVFRQAPQPREEKAKTWACHHKMWDLRKFRGNRATRKN